MRLRLSQHLLQRLLAVELPLCFAVLVATPSCAIVDEVGRLSNLTLQGLGSKNAQGREEGNWKYEEDGKVQFEGAYEDGVKVGPWRTYYPDGTPESQVRIENEKREGPYRYWHPNGHLKTVGHYADGREFGHWTFWDRNGRISSEGTFINGNREGVWRKYTDGVLTSELRYLQGDPVGRGATFDSSGAGEASFFWSDMPEGLEWTVESWDGSAEVRRQGFLMNGRPHGLWRLNHRDGDLRLVGEFVDGRPEGQWAAFGEGSKLLAQGRVQAGRPVGPWLLLRDGTLEKVDSASFAPSMHTGGAWSERALADESGAEEALGIWLSEARSPMVSATVTDDAQPTSPASTISQVEQAAAAEQEDVPTRMLPFNSADVSGFQRLVRAYRGRLEPGGSLYLPGQGPGPGLEADSLGGDDTRAAEYEGKPLPLTTFMDQFGEPVELDDYRGQRVVLVVLRGITAGGVCIYCAAQITALQAENAYEQVASKGAHLFVLFPSAKNGLPSFKNAVSQLGENIEAELICGSDYIVGSMLRLEGEKVIPSTFVLDEEGIVRYAYVGKSDQDRPAVSKILEELDKLDDE